MNNNIFFRLMAVLCCFVAFAGQSFAQDFNKSYPMTVNGNNVQLEAVDIIGDDDGNTYTLSKNYNDEVMLSMADPAGTPVWSSATGLFNSFHAITPYKIVRTDNGNLLVVGLVTNWLTGVTNPFAALFDGGGNYMFSRTYNSNTTYNMNNSINHTRVNIVRAATEAESYIVVAPGSQDNLSWTMPFPGFFGTYEDVLVNALKIDGNTLAVDWNYKYYYLDMDDRADHLSTHPNYNGSSVISWRNHPQGLTHVFADGEDKYVIAGTTLQNILIPNTTSTALDEYTFVMSINNNGTITNPHHGEYAEGSPYGHNLMWDVSTNEVIMSFSIDNTNLASLAAHNPSNTPQAVIGLMKLATGDLSVPSGMVDYYFLEDYYGNLAYGIMHGLNGNEYVIPAWTLDNTSSFNGSISLLEINKSSGIPNTNYFHTYNIDANTYMAAGTTTGFMYALAGWKPKPFHADGDIRVTAPDAGGSTCGIDGWTEGQGDYAIPYTEGPYDLWSLERERTANNYPLKALASTINEDDCYASPNPNAWKPAGISQVNTKQDLLVYPSIITDAINTINISINSNADATISAAIYSMDGRLVQKKAFEVSKGKNTFSWPTSLPSSGNYIIKTESATADYLNSTTRLIKL